MATDFVHGVSSRTGDCAVLRCQHMQGWVSVARILAGSAIFSSTRIYRFSCRCSLYVGLSGPHAARVGFIVWLSARSSVCGWNLGRENYIRRIRGIKIRSGYYLVASRTTHTGCPTIHQRSGTFHLRNAPSHLRDSDQSLSRDLTRTPST